MYQPLGQVRVDQQGIGLLGLLASHQGLVEPVESDAHVGQRRPGPRIAGPLGQPAQLDLGPFELPLQGPGFDQLQRVLCARWSAMPSGRR